MGDSLRQATLAIVMCKWDVSMGETSFLLAHLLTSHRAGSRPLLPHAHRPTAPKGNTATVLYLERQFFTPHPHSSLLAGSWSREDFTDQRPIFLFFQSFHQQVILQHAPFSLVLEATGNYRKENTMRIRSHYILLAQDFCSLGECRKPNGTQ